MKVLRRGLGAAVLPDGSKVGWVLSTERGTRRVAGSYRGETGARSSLEERVLRPGETFPVSTWWVGQTPDVDTEPAGGFHAWDLAFVPAARVTPAVRREADAAALPEARRLVARRREVLKARVPCPVAPGTGRRMCAFEVSPACGGCPDPVEAAPAASAEPLS